MPYSRPLTLKVANRKDFSFLLCGLFVVAMVSAVLSPYPVLLVLLTTFIFGAGQLLFTLDFSKVTKPNLILINFPDGQLRTKSNDELKIEGYLSGQQWCTHYAAVLRYKTEGGFKRMVLLSRQQNGHDYRRLKVCLQQGFVVTLL